MVGFGVVLLVDLVAALFAGLFPTFCVVFALFEVVAMDLPPP